jgi:hypothetical protein
MYPSITFHRMNGPFIRPDLTEWASSSFGLTPGRLMNGTFIRQAVRHRPRTCAQDQASMSRGAGDHHGTRTSEPDATQSAEPDE